MVAGAFGVTAGIRRSQGMVTDIIILINWLIPIKFSIFDAFITFCNPLSSLFQSAIFCIMSVVAIFFTIPIFVVAGYGIKRAYEINNTADGESVVVPTNPQVRMIGKDLNIDQISIFGQCLTFDKLLKEMSVDSNELFSFVRTIPTGFKIGNDN